MSVKRYQPVAQCVEPSYQAQMIVPKVMEFSEGEYVRWEDYDATCETLAHTETERDASDAEVERLKAEVERLNSQFANSERQVERLRKAGDITSQRLHWFCQKWGWKDEDLKTLTPEWNAAKEGKPSV